MIGEDDPSSLWLCVHHYHHHHDPRVFSFLDLLHRHRHHHRLTPKSVIMLVVSEALWNKTEERASVPYCQKEQ